MQLEPAHQQQLDTANLVLLECLGQILN
jgi:hypothetical protein